jgi:hypothetical protein
MEVPRYIKDAPVVESQKGVKMQPVEVPGFDLDQTPEGHRVFRRFDGADQKLYARIGDRYNGYDNFDSAHRALKRKLPELKA